MNKHILLTMKWLANPESVSQEEFNDAADAAAYAAAADATYARYWVAEFFEATGENKDDYIAELSK